MFDTRWYRGIVEAVFGIWFRYRCFILDYAVPMLLRWVSELLSLESLTQYYHSWNKVWAPIHDKTIARVREDLEDVYSLIRGSLPVHVRGVGDLLDYLFSTRRQIYKHATSGQRYISFLCILRSRLQRYTPPSRCKYKLRRFITQVLHLLVCLPFSLPVFQAFGTFLISPVEIRRHERVYCWSKCNHGKCHGMTTNILRSFTWRV